MLSHRVIRLVVSRWMGQCVWGCHFVIAYSELKYYFCNVYIPDCSWCVDDWVSFLRELYLSIGSENVMSNWNCLLCKL